MEEVEFDHNDPEHWLSLGLTALSDDEVEAASHCFLRSISMAPTNIQAHFGLGECLLSQGEFGPGWKEYEWRTLTEQGKKGLATTSSPIWNGMRIPKGRIFFIADEGYGDAIQFCRFLPLIEDRCQEVVLGCSTELLPLMKTLPGNRFLTNRWADVPAHAAHCRLSSLGNVLNVHPDAIPTKPYLSADADRVAAWRSKLPVGGIGLTWTGRKTGSDAQKRRDMDPGLLAPLFSLGCQFVSLQKEPIGALPIMDISDSLTDFGETAAVVANLDLVITVDTAVAHLAGAMGKPVWVMLPKPCDWRWQRGRTDSPWYPTARLFRQPSCGDWTSVIEGVGKAIISYA